MENTNLHHLRIAWALKGLASLEEIFAWSDFVARTRV